MLNTSAPQVQRSRGHAAIVQVGSNQAAICSSLHSPVRAASSSFDVCHLPPSGWDFLQARNRKKGSSNQTEFSFMTMLKTWIYDYIVELNMSFIPLHLEQTSHDSCYQ